MSTLDVVCVLFLETTSLCLTYSISTIYKIFVNSIVSLNGILYKVLK